VLEEFRSFLVVLEEGSLRRAAERLHVSQPALIRQVQMLEHDLGGRVPERTSAGVRPTSEGHALAEKARALLGYYDFTVAEARKLVRGESEQLRIGYLVSAGQEYLGRALAGVRRAHPKSMETISNTVPHARFGTPDEIANAAPLTFSKTSI
jgi:DNA-binding transcriptional LysR family regulator